MSSFLNQYNFREIRDPSGPLSLPVGVEIEAWITDLNGMLVQMEPGHFNWKEEIFVYGGRQGTADKIIPELPCQQVELVTAIAADAKELAASLMRLKKRMEGFKSRWNYWPVYSSMPPTKLLPQDLQVFPLERYLQIYEQIGPDVLQYGWIAGLHIHLGVSSFREAMDLFNRLRSYLPFLAAISTTGPERYDSCKTFVRKLNKPMIPPHVCSHEHLHMLADTQGFVKSPNDCRWLMFFTGQGTIKLCLFDVQPSFQQVLELASVVRVLAKYALGQSLDNAPSIKVLGKQLDDAFSHPEKQYRSALETLELLRQQAKQVAMSEEGLYIAQLMHRLEIRLRDGQQSVA